MEQLTKDGLSVHRPGWQMRRGTRRFARAYPSSISSLTSWVRLTPPRVRTILAGSFSLPLRRPASIASRTAFSISRCEVMPTFFRNLRRLALKTSSFMRASWLGPDRIVQHLLGHIALGPVGTGIDIAALHVAVLAAV